MGTGNGGLRRRTLPPDIVCPLPQCLGHLVCSLSIGMVPRVSPLEPTSKSEPHGSMTPPAGSTGKIGMGTDGLPRILRANTPFKPNCSSPTVKPLESILSWLARPYNRWCCSSVRLPCSTSLLEETGTGIVADFSHHSLAQCVSKRRFDLDAHDLHSWSLWGLSVFEFGHSYAARFVSLFAMFLLALIMFEMLPTMHRNIIALTGSQPKRTRQK